MASKSTYLDRLPEHLRVQGEITNGEIELRPLSDGREANEGIVYEDAYVLLLRDPVIFPGRKTGHYIRLVEKASLSVGTSGTIIVPVTETHVFFIRVFRHATRSWEWELPRGFQEPGIDPIQNAEKEVKEEIGVKPIETIFLGRVKPNTGILSNESQSFLAKLPDSAESSAVAQAEEAIQAVKAVSKNELGQFVLKNVTCGFSLSALLQARLLGFLNF